MKILECEQVRGVKANIIVVIHPNNEYDTVIDAAE